MGMSLPARGELATVVSREVGSTIAIVAYGVFLPAPAGSSGIPLPVPALIFPYATKVPADMSDKVCVASGGVPPPAWLGAGEGSVLRDVLPAWLGAGIGLSLSFEICCFAVMRMR